MKTISQSLTFLCFAMMLLAACSSEKAKVSVEEVPSLELLVGTYTGQGSDGIYLLDFNPETGAIANKGLVAKTTNPSYLTISKDRNKVFAVNETENGSVSSFRWNDERTELALVSTQPSQGDYPCYAALNADESLFALGNYMTGNILAYQVDKVGVVQPNPFVGQHVGEGANPDRQEGPHAHCTEFSPNGKFLYAVDLGIDQVVKYPVSDTTIGEQSTALTLKPGDGPRHIIFHPTKAVAYVITELSSTVVTATLDAASGDMTSIARVSTLPDDFDGESFCADIHLSDDGRFVYASNRGHNSITVFAVGEDGSLSMLETESVKGDWPRNFTLSPDASNAFLLVANQKSNNITVFQRDEATGLLTPTAHEVEVSQPVCLKF